MSSNKRYVRLHGIIRGNGHEATCTIRALEVTLPGAPDVRAYAEFQVERVSENLPEGNYTITVNGETQNVRHQGGFWLAA